jgi:hypothetical protein
MNFTIKFKKNKKEREFQPQSKKPTQLGHICTSWVEVQIHSPSLTSRTTDSEVKFSTENVALHIDLRHFYPY